MGNDSSELDSSEIEKTEPDVNPKPDVAAAHELRSSLRDFTEAIAEPGIGRAERVSRARTAAEAIRDVPQAVAALNPYVNSEFSELIDQVAISATGSRGPSPTARAAAADRLSLRNLVREVLPPALSNGMELLLQPQPPASPWGGTVVSQIERFLQQISPWFLSAARETTRQPGVKEIHPTLLEDLPEPTINPNVPATEIPSSGTVIDSVPVEWDMAALVVDASMQLLDWAVEARVFEETVKAAVLIGLERAIANRLIATATVETSFEAAEAATGAAWVTEADTVLTSPQDLPRVRRIYAGEGLTDPAMRPLLRASSGIPEGKALVFPSSAIDLQRTDFFVAAASRPSTLGQAVAVVMEASVTVRASGAVAVVDVAPAP